VLFGQLGSASNAAGDTTDHKAGLKQPVSFKQKDMDKIVCRIRDKVGTHFKTLQCETNRQYTGGASSAAAGLCAMQ